MWAYSYSNTSIFVIRLIFYSYFYHVSPSTRMLIAGDVTREYFLFECFNFCYTIDILSLFLAEIEYAKHKISIVSKVSKSCRIWTKNVLMSQPCPLLVYLCIPCAVECKIAPVPSLEFIFLKGFFDSSHVFLKNFTNPEFNKHEI